MSFFCRRFAPVSSLHCALVTHFYKGNIMKQFIRIAAILALGFGFTVGSVLAKDDHDTKPKVSGEISNVNAAAQTFQIKDQNEQMMTFKANPATEFELKKSSKLSWDKDGTSIRCASGRSSAGFCCGLRTRR